MYSRKTVTFLQNKLKTKKGKKVWQMVFWEITLLLPCFISNQCFNNPFIQGPLLSRMWPNGHNLRHRFHLGTFTNRKIDFGLFTLRTCAGHETTTHRDGSNRRTIRSRSSSGPGTLSRTGKEHSRTGVSNSNWPGVPHETFKRDLEGRKK